MRSILAIVTAFLVSSCTSSPPGGANPVSRTSIPAARAPSAPVAPVAPAPREIAPLPENYGVAWTIGGEKGWTFPQPDQPLWDGPGCGRVIGKVAPGARLLVIDSKMGKVGERDALFYRVRTPEGAVGWIVWASLRWTDPATGLDFDS